MLEENNLKLKQTILKMKTMKTLRIEQMELLNGGSWWSCAGNIAGLVGSVAVTAGLATITAGTALLFMAGFTYSGIASALSCAQAIGGE